MGGPGRADGGDVVSAEEYAAIVAALRTAHLVMSPDLAIVEVHLPLDELCDQLLHRLVDGRHSDDVAHVAVRHEGVRA